MTEHDILYYLVQVVLSLVGSATFIVYILKKESDKFEDTKENFNEKKYFRKNKWDFLFYVLSGLVMLTVKSIVRDYIGLEGITDMGLSCMCGLLGSVVIEKLVSKKV